MKTPPFLLGVALLFWGWQSGFFLVSVVMAAGLESERWLKSRWDFSEQDFTRIWTFCSLVLLGAAVYAFTTNEGPADFRGLLRNPSLMAQRNAGLATGRAAAAVFRWLPMIFFLFAAAQAWSAREGVPIEALSRILRRRWQRASKLGQPAPLGRRVNISYPYLALCLFAASVHASENNTYFWGLCALLGWALWPQRSRRFGLALWAASLGIAVALGYGSERGLGQVQRYLGNFNPQWFTAFGHRSSDPARSRTALGRIGRVKTSGQIVIRLQARQSPAPRLLREASYRTYKQQTWYADEKETENVRQEATNSTTYILLRGKTNTAALNIACYLDGGKGLLPLPEGSGRLEKLSVYLDLQKSSLGAVIVPEGPELVMFDAHYGPGATLDSPANTNEDLAVPEREAPALEQVVAELQLDAQTPPQKLRTLSKFFQEKFTYRMWQELGRQARTNESPLSRFLLHTRSGHCEYFATAGVLLLRQANIPARYAVGYAVHEGSGGNYVVRQRDSHAWCLVWNEQTGGWQDWDFTPASWVEIEASRASGMQRLSDAWSWVRFELSRLRWGQTHLRQYLLWSLVPVLVVLLFQIIFQSRRQRRHHDAGTSARAVSWPGLDSEFYQLEREVAARGLARQTGEPLSVWLGRALEGAARADLRAAVEKSLRQHYRYRFDPQGLSPEEREELRREVRACLARVTE